MGSRGAGLGGGRCLEGWRVQGASAGRPLETQVASVLGHPPPAPVHLSRRRGARAWVIGMDGLTWEPAWVVGQGGGVPGPGRSGGGQRCPGRHPGCLGARAGPWPAVPGCRACRWHLTSPLPALVAPAGRLRHPGGRHLAGRHAGELRHPVLLLPFPVGRQSAHRHRHPGHGHRLRGLHRGHQGEQVPPAHRECGEGRGVGRGAPRHARAASGSPRPGRGSL